MNIANDNNIDNSALSTTPSFPYRKQLKGYLFNSAMANGHILTTSRLSEENYCILNCDRGSQYPEE